jgi:hypothetical protein
MRIPTVESATLVTVTCNEALGISTAPWAGGSLLVRSLRANAVWRDAEASARCAQEERAMTRTLAELPAGSRGTDHISPGVIAKSFPTEKIREALRQTRRASLRERGLPAHVVVYYLIATAGPSSSPTASTGPPNRSSSSNSSCSTR